MYGALVIALFGILLAFTFLMVRTDPAPAGEPVADPYADEVAAFRRELHDWDRP